MNQVSNVMGASKTHKGSVTGAKTRDPGGFTSSMQTGGTIAGV